MKQHTLHVGSHNTAVGLVALAALSVALLLWSLLAAGLVSLVALAATGRTALRLRTHGALAASFTNLSAGQLAALASRAERVRFRAGSVLFRQDAPADRLYLLVSGEVELLRRDEEGVYAPVALVGAGSWLGEAGLLGRTAHSVAAKAAADVEALVLDREVLAAVLDPAPAVEVVSLLPAALGNEMPTRLRLLGNALRRTDRDAALWLLGSPLAATPYPAVGSENAGATWRLVQRH